MRFSLLLLLGTVFGEFINDNCVRSLDLTSHILRERRAIALSQGSGKPEKEYLVSVQELVNSTLAFIGVKQKEGEEQKELDVEFVKKGDNGVLLYRVKPDLTQDKLVLIVDLAYIGAYSPHPSQVGQNDKQYVQVTTNAYLSSPYVTKKQKLKVSLSSSSVPFYTRLEPVEKSGRQLTYGPFEKDVEPFSHEELTLKVENNAPFLTMKTFRRELWLSHWGSNLAVEEHYAVKHEGAKLKGEFSRVDFAQNQINHEQTQVVKMMTLELPLDASEVYYRDDVGNVSTSNLRYERKRSVLELKPRFPLYGGWWYTWYVGYNAPLSEFVRYLNGEYVFQAPFVKALENTPIEKMTLKIVLPEGATDYKVHLPFSVDSQETSKSFTYVDTLGRPTILIEKSNVVDEHSLKPIQVTYKFSTTAYWRKPLVMSSGFLLVFVLAMVSMRAETSLKKQTKKE